MADWFSGLGAVLKDFVQPKLDQQRKQTLPPRPRVAPNSLPGGNTASFPSQPVSTENVLTLGDGPPGVAAWVVGEVVFLFDTPASPQAWAKATDAYVGPAEPGPDGTCSVVFWTIWPADTARSIVAYYTGAVDCDITVTYWEQRVGRNG